MSLSATLARSKAERESWRYTNLEQLLARPVTRKDVITAPVATNFTHRLTFINGVWDSTQSRLGDLPPDILRGDAAQGYILELAGQICLVTAPIELLFLSTQDGEWANRLCINLGQSGRLTLIERHEGGNATHSLDTEVNLQPQAKLVHGKIIKGHNAAVHLAQTQVQIAEGAYYDQFTLIQGGKITRNEIEAALNGKLAQCTLNGAMLLRGNSHADTTTRIHHNAPHTTSREIYKSVIAEQARAVFQGKIIVKQDAQKTDGHQLSRALLLSDQAEMDAKPELEIYADDVKCSHGCTIGDLDEEALFYLRARGLDEASARALLIEAFVGEILDEIHVDELRDICRANVERWLHDQI